LFETSGHYIDSTDTGFVHDIINVLDFVPLELIDISISLPVVVF